MLQRLVDAAAVAAEIARVRSLSGGALRRRWQAVFGRPPPEHLTADLLRRMIANRVQEEAFGTLDRATLKLLDGLARRDGSRPAGRNLKVGTVLVRDYQGRRHTVTVDPEGYVWEGNLYSSLSAIARDQDPEALVPYLVELAQKARIVGERAELAGGAGVVLERPIWRGRNDQVHRGVRYCREVASVTE
jgi:hypothetical protein